MKHTPLLIIITLLLLGGCEMPEYPTTISGTLYTDSTLTTPVAGDTVWFCDYVSRYNDSSLVGEYLGHAYTDSLGRFAFTFWNFDVTKSEYERRKAFYNTFFAIYGQDTLFMGRYRSEYRKLIFYPGRQWMIHL